VKNKHLKVIKGDVLIKKQLTPAMEDHDIVVHLAASLEILNMMEYPEVDLMVNAGGTLNVLDTMRKLDINKIVYASSAGVYGEPQRIPMFEEDRLEPYWYYGVSKLAGEHYCKAFNKLYGIRAGIPRYSIVYGPREWFGRVLTIFINHVLDNKQPIVFGDGQQLRDFVYIKDVAKVTADLVEYPFYYDIFNIGTEKGTKIEDLAQIVLKIMKREDLSYRFEDPKSGELGRKYGELKRLVLRIQKAREKLNYRPTTALSSGIKNLIEWAKENRDEYWKGKTPRY